MFNSVPRIEASTVYFRFQYLASCKKLIKPVHTPKTQTRTVWCWALHLLHHSLIDTKPTTQTANNPVNIVYNKRQNYDQVICTFVRQCLFCDSFIEFIDRWWLIFLDKIDLKDSMLLMCHYMFSCWHTVNGKIEFH